ncbi:uncharacterized protein M6B38_163765 [Iris pallida]|uniref:Secreted protein n=1 Tax=Iris pallida TaxID=29817 RepID=A0AAX6EY37_IRIPA|nr:uncharacterized protein M6B38_163765 [Iris pallida]
MEVSLVFLHCCCCTPTAATVPKIWWSVEKLSSDRSEHHDGWINPGRPPASRAVSSSSCLAGSRYLDWLSTVV